MVIAPICLASESSRKKIEKAITGKETKTGPEPKKTRESIRDLHAAGFDLVETTRTVRTRTRPREP